MRLDAETVFALRFPAPRADALRATAAHTHRLLEDLKHDVRAVAVAEHHHSLRVGSGPEVGLRGRGVLAWALGSSAAASGTQNALQDARDLQQRHSSVCRASKPAAAHIQILVEAGPHVPYARRKCALTCRCRPSRFTRVRCTPCGPRYTEGLTCGGQGRRGAVARLWWCIRRSRRCTGVRDQALNCRQPEQCMRIGPAKLGSCLAGGSATGNCTASPRPNLQMGGNLSDRLHRPRHRLAWS